ncbi:PAS domain S-box-containing protein [Allochromatium warmingii]|uniref:Sensory/regulatory protein RpfC n=1 Tax=Allochromatium warmingii TaxID=61595 RepID=A0A1H3BYZ0_ALLWA|nr:PAS domain S-box-containing protein [Allochromatium warmingii]
MRIALFYGLLAALWIVLSDVLLMWLLPQPASLQFWIELAKGLAFVSLTSLLLHLLLRTWERQISAAFVREHQSEERYRSVFENNHAVMFIVDPESGAIVDANPAAVQFYGWSRETLQQMNVMEINTRSPEQIRAEMQAAKTARRHYFEFPHRLADGSVRDVEVYSGRITLDNRTLLYSIVHDVTERRRTLQALAASEARLQQLSLAIEQSPNSILITDLEARIQYVNQAFLTTTGYALNEVLGSNPRLLQSGQTPHTTYATMWATLTLGMTWKGEFHNRRKDGNNYIEFAHVAPLRQQDGTITHYVAVKEDITDKKRIAAELDQHRHHLEELVKQRTVELTTARQQAEAANLAKSAFLANMSHEIRTPMNGVLGMIELLALTPLTPEQTQRLNTIRESGKSLLHLIDDILDFSKIEAGRLELEQAPVALAPLVADLCAALEPLASSRAVDLRYTIAPTLPEWVNSDAVRLRQLLYNLVGNGIKFAQGHDGQRGWVQVRLEPATDPAYTLTLSVADNGIGMSAEAQAQLFKPFGQAEASTTRRFGGTGLGLTICKRIVDLLGGVMTVDSAPQCGATFSVQLPLEAAAIPPSTPALERPAAAPPEPAPTPEPTASAPAAPIPAPAGERRLLIAEDDEINQEVIQLQLDMLGYQVDIANHGLEALELWRRNRGRYLALLTDLHMPQMDGYSLTAAIRREEAEHNERTGQTEHLPILALTANALRGEAERAQELGMDAYLTKPLMLEDLERALIQWLGTAPPSPHPDANGQTLDAQSSAAPLS